MQNLARTYRSRGLASRQHWSGRLAGLVGFVAASLALGLIVAGAAGCCYVPSQGAAYQSPCAPAACPPAGRCKVYSEPQLRYRDVYGCPRLMGESAYRRYFGLEQGTLPDPQ